MASTKKRADGKWRARYRDPGGKEHARHFDRKVDAERWLTSIESSKLAGTYIEPNAGKQTFASFADEWAEAQDWKRTRRDSWVSVCARLVPLLGDLPLQSISRLTLQVAQHSLSERYARSTVKTTMGYAGSIMRAAHATGRIGRDPTLGLRAPRPRAGEPDGRVSPKEVPTRAEALGILEAAPPRGIGRRSHLGWRDFG